MPQVTETPTCFVSALLSLSRFLEEKLITPEDLPAKKGQQIRNQTSTTFELAVPDDQSLATFRVVLEYSVNLTMSLDDERSAELCTYQSKFVGYFDVANKDGFVNWHDVSDEAIRPYFSFCHQLVRARAEQSLLAAGFRGIELAVPEDLKGKSRETSMPLTEANS
jgi:hypothetical protein